MPFQPTIEEIKNATVETVTIEIAEEYADLHPVAQGLIIGDNSSAILADLVRDVEVSKQARAEIVEIWDDMASVDREATIRTLLNRQSKKLLGYPLTVKNGKLEKAKTRNKTSAKGSESGSAPAAETVDITRDDDLTRIKRFFVTADDQEKATLLALVAQLEEKRNA
jgi:hypothetical protein